MSLPDDERRKLRERLKHEQDECLTLEELSQLGKRRGYKAPLPWANLIWSRRMQQEAVK